MHIQELREMIDRMEREGLEEFRTFDDFTGTSSRVVVQSVWVDSKGGIVDESRRQALITEPYNPKDYLEVYLSDNSWQEQYTDFKSFFQAMESDRLLEVFLVNNAKAVALIGPASPAMT